MAVVITDAQLPWLIGVGSAALVVGIWFCILAVEDIRRRARRRKGRAVGRARAPLAVDLHSEAYAETGIAMAAPGEAVDDRIRAEAARDAAGAAFVTPGCRLADEFLAVMFPRKGAPKEGP